MKRIIRASAFDEIINITAYFVPEGYSANDLAASTIVPIHKGRLLDEQAMAQWNNFIDNVLATLDYYDFDVVDNNKLNDKLKEFANIINAEVTSSKIILNGKCEKCKNKER